MALTKYPIPEINVGWYQALNLWTLVEQSTTRRQLPYITRNQILADKKAPIHYYMDQKFVMGTNYLFSTSTENYVYGKRMSSSIIFENTNSDAYTSDLYITLPWGEVQKIQTPYINTIINGLGDDIITKISNININSYGNINGFSYNNSKLLDDDAKMTGKPVHTIICKKDANIAQNPITYTAKSKFASCGISNVDIIDCPWDIQGYASFNFLNQTVVGPAVTGQGSKITTISINGEPMGSKGWNYLSDEKKLVWFDKVAPGNNNPDIDVNLNMPVGGNVYDYYSNKSASMKYLVNNFAAMFINQQEFSVKFEYSNDSNFGVSIYVGKNLPYKKSESEWWQTNIDDLLLSGDVTLIGKMRKSINDDGKNTQTCEFYGLEGNQYLFFVADPILEFRTKKADETVYKISTNIVDNKIKPTATGFILSNGTTGFATYSTIILSDFSIITNYHKSNNTIISSGNNWSQTTNDVSYKIDIGTGNTVFEKNKVVSSYNSKAGNSSFYSGIWENGVWNNGFRDDITREEFYSIDNYYSYNKDRTWRFTIKGSTYSYSVSKIKIGDKVAIGNVTAIDINDNRRLLKKFYKVNDITENGIEVEFDTDFPLRRIEIDSENHRITVTKNIWLNGVFLSGLFRGVWNNGLFSGYPMITKMDESQWIDGIFNGGHFTARKKSLQWNQTKLGVLDNNSWLQISTPQPHGLTKGDIISITYSKSDGNIGYFGTTEVQKTPDDKNIITGISWIDEYKSISGGGQILSVISTGLIQNFEFRSNNISKSTSIETMTSERVFSYNSWIDVNYSNQSAVNIGRPPTNTEPFSKRMYSDNNLYGYPTSDVLSSTSIFRDSYSLSNRKYFLGSKYKKTSDYIGDVSSFEDYFESTDTDKGVEQFRKLGWDFVVPYTKVQIPTTKQQLGVNQLSLWIKDNFYLSQLNINKVIQITGPTLDGEYITDISKILATTSDINGTKLTTDNSRNTWDISGNFIISLTMSSSATFSRTPEPITNDSPTQGKELRVSVINAGGMLDLIPAYQVPNRTNGKEKSTVERGRYTMAEFDLIDFTTGTSSTTIDKGDGIIRPAINFNNINTSIRKTYDVNGIGLDSELKSSYLPIYENVNHINTIGKTKQEFFFNKKNLMMNFTGVGRDGTSSAEFYIDNLKFYELDMIPFFKYFKSPSGKLGNINTSIQIPKNGEAPLIVDSIDDIVEESTQNEVINTFVAKLIAPDIGIPSGINWQQDYNIYRTQDTEGDDIIGLYSGL